MPHCATRGGGATDSPETWTIERCRRILARKAPDRTWTDDEVIRLRDTLSTIADLHLQILRNSAR